jgi:hypothetical protein
VSQTTTPLGGTVTSDFLHLSGRTGDLPADSGCVIDCDTCAVRGDACGDCVVSVMLGGPPGAVTVDAAEQRALSVLAEAGLVPPLQMTPPPPGRPGTGSPEHS